LLPYRIPALLGLRLLWTSPCTRASAVPACLCLPPPLPRIAACCLLPPLQRFRTACLLLRIAGTAAAALPLPASAVRLGCCHYARNAGFFCRSAVSACRFLPRIAATCPACRYNVLTVAPAAFCIYHRGSAVLLDSTCLPPRGSLCVSAWFPPRATLPPHMVCRSCTATWSPL